MESIFTALAILIWVGVGALIALCVWMWDERRKAKAEPDYSPFAILLGKPCWRNVNGDYEKFRVVAVSHKGAVAVRPWDDDSGRGARWVPKGTAQRNLRFGDDPHDGIEVSR